MAAHFLLSPICSTPRQALPELMPTHNSKHTVILWAGHAARSLWADGNQNQLEHRVTQWGMYLYGLILQSGEFLSNRQKGEEQEHLLQAGWWNIRSANQAQKECRRGQVEHWAPWMTTSGQQSRLIWSRSLFCDAQGTPLTHWHYRKLSPVFPSNPPQLHLCALQKP